MKARETYDPSEVQAALELLHVPGTVFEVRILRAGRDGTVSGYFNNPTTASEAIAAYDGRVPGVYVTMNPVDPSLLARAQNRLQDHASDTTTDKDVIHRRWLLIDVDSCRPSGISATEEELEAAISVGWKIKAYLEEELHWPDGIVVVSGNGTHLLYRVDLPNDDTSRGLVKNVLFALAARFDDADVHVDTSVYNAARILKVPGTMACKGDDLQERPHRRAHILDGPERLTTVSVTLLKALADTADSARVPGTGGPVGPRFDVEAFIERTGLEVRKTKRNADGDLWELETCPFNPEHNRGEAFILQLPNGALGAGCHHESCTWGWRELREKYDTNTDSGVLDGDDWVQIQIARLAALDASAYERERKQAAKDLGMRVTELDRLVSSRRQKRPGGDRLVLMDPELWPDAVDGGELLSELQATVRRYMSLPSGGAEAFALWCVHAHAHDAADVSPILAVTSPTPECGKSNLMTILFAITPRPVFAVDFTAPTVFRTVDRFYPTLLIDEADTYLRDNPELKGVLNSGHARVGSYVPRLVGDNYEPTLFRTWAPKAIAMIGNLPPTLASRSIHIRLERLAPGESVEPLQLHQLSVFLPLQQKAARWAADHLDVLRGYEPEIPPGLRGRAADNWRPLLAIAEVAGGIWPEQARKVAMIPSGTTSVQTAGIMLLEDLRQVFGDLDRLPTKDILAELNAMEHRPWPEWSHGRELSPTGIAKLLEPFGIRPRTIRPGDGRTPKGYLKEQFENAFTRYLPATPPQSADETEEIMEPPATPDGSVADAQCREPASKTVCGDVADGGPPGGDGLGKGPSVGDLSEKARKAMEEVDRCRYRIRLDGEEISYLPYGHFHIGDRGPVPREVKRMVRECKAELIPRIRWEQAARAMIIEGTGRMNDIMYASSFTGFVVTDPFWENYERRLDEAFAAGDGDQLETLLEERERAAKFFAEE